MAETLGALRAWATQTAREEATAAFEAYERWEAAGASGAAPRLDGLAIDFIGASDRLNDRSAAELDALAGFVVARPGARVAIDVHVASQSDSDANATLSRARAATISARLVGAGVVETRITARGRGDAVPPATAQGPFAGDRVEIALTPR